MRVLLTHPMARHPMLVSDDLGLGYLATALRRAGHEVRLSLASVGADGLEAIIREYAPDLVGIKLFCTSAPAVNRTIALVKRVRPSATVLVGGPQVNADPHRVLNYVDADMAMWGDCEQSLPAYVAALAGGHDVSDIPGLIRRATDGALVNPPDCITDLDALGMPAWDLMPPHRGGEMQLSRHSPTASVLTSRGCRGRCTFCSEAGGTLRFRSPEAVMEELVVLRDTYGVQEIMFQDSNFLARPARVEALCRMMIDSQFGVPWSVPYGTRWETISVELLSLMKEAGCYRISIGVESGSPRWQKATGKNINLERLHQKLLECRPAGVEVMANFMLGFPGETRDEMRMTRKLALTLPVDYVSFWIFTPYPGCALYEELVEQGQVRREEFEQFDKSDYANNLSAVPARTLHRMARRNLFSFYGRPRGLWTLARNLRYPPFFRVVFRHLYFMFFPGGHSDRAY